RPYSIGASTSERNQELAGRATRSVPLQGARANRGGQPARAPVHRTGRRGRGAVSDLGRISAQEGGRETPGLSSGSAYAHRRRLDAEIRSQGGAQGAGGNEGTRYVGLLCSGSRSSIARSRYGTGATSPRTRQRRQPA